MKNEECIMIESRKFSTGEEIVNVFTHALGALMSIYGTVILTGASKNTAQSLSTTIFGGTLFLMFLSSVCYHAVTNATVKKSFEKLDHTAIYILIAGTYTPVLILTVKFPLSIALIGLIWVIAIAGIGFTCRTLKSEFLSTVIYLILGWLSLFFVYNLWTTSHLSLWLLFGGGVFYSLGCIFYLMKLRYMHSIWHLFVIAGAVMHYFAIMELLKVVNFTV